MTKANARSGEREIKYLQIGQLLEAKNVFLFARVLFVSISLIKFASLIGGYEALVDFSGER